jgi:cytochrome c nitrite reductase small subunit
MNDEFVSWQKAGHHQAARFVDCHLPHFIPKYLAKADNGWRHSRAFTLQNFHEPIQITPHNADNLQAKSWSAARARRCAIR